MLTPLFQKAQSSYSAYLKKKQPHVRIDAIIECLM